MQPASESFKRYGSITLFVADYFEFNWTVFQAMIEFLEGRAEAEQVEFVREDWQIRSDKVSLRSGNHAP